MSRREISISDNLSRFLSGLGSLIAILLLMLILFLRLDAMFFNIEGNIIGTLNYVKEWVTIILIIIVGLEVVVKKGFVMFIVFAVIAAAVVVLMFFPEVTSQFLN